MKLVLEVIHTMPDEVTLRSAIEELGELQLALVGGGIADTIPH